MYVIILIYLYILRLARCIELKSNIMLDNFLYKLNYIILC